MASKVHYVGPTGTGRSNAYFVASLNEGPPGGQSFIWGGTGPLPPVVPPLRTTRGSENVEIMLLVLLVIPRYLNLVSDRNRVFFSAE